MSIQRFALASIVAFCAVHPAFAQDAATVDKALHDRALGILRHTMAYTEEWVKVHAAESLLWTGYPEGVRETFLEDLDTAGPKYRIGVWRVLAQDAEGAERERYTQNIVNAFLDTEGPDRLHAAETLGKLAYYGNRQAFLDAAQGKHSEERPGAFEGCCRWVLARSGKAEDEAAIAARLGSDDPEARGLAAYAFRFFPSLRPESCAKLEAALAKESEDSSWRTHMLSATYVHAPEAKRPALKKELIVLARTGSTGAKREVCAALGRVPDPADLPLLIGLLDDEDLDAQSGAAETILRIERAQR